MRKLVLLAVAGAALVLTGASLPAASVTKAVKITSSGFSPATVTIATTDAVKWSNKDTNSHQVVANNGAFASPIIAAGHTWTRTFNTAGTYRYHDALHPSLTGKVVVTGPPPDVTIGAALPIVTYGDSTTVSGAVSNKQAGETVTVYQQLYGDASQTLIATLLTGTNGVWSLTVKPSLLTTYQAHWKSTISAPIMIAVKPHVAFTVGKRYAAVKVKAARSMAGRKVYIQRFTRFHEWVKIRKVILNASSGAHFRLRLAPGRYLLRAYITVNQAGAGYLDGESHTVSVHRR
ncbi:MAG: cupredoxin domain-containing protein [Gaiellaceae bacterium]